MERLFESITQKKIEVGETKEDDMEIGKDTRPDWTSIGFQVIFLGNFLFIRVPSIENFFFNFFKGFPLMKFYTMEIQGKYSLNFWFFLLVSLLMKLYCNFPWKIPTAACSNMRILNMRLFDSKREHNSKEHRK